MYKRQVLPVPEETVFVPTAVLPSRPVAAAFTPSAELAAPDARDLVPMDVLNAPDALDPSPQARLLAIPVPNEGSGAPGKGVGAPPVAQASARARSLGTVTKLRARMPSKAGDKGRLFITFRRFKIFTKSKST